MRGSGSESRVSRPWLIGGPGATPRKIRPMLVSKWPNIGHIRVQIRIYGHKWPLYHVGTTYKCPRISRGDLRGLSPRNSHRLPPISQGLADGNFRNWNHGNCSSQITKKIRPSPKPPTVVPAWNPNGVQKSIPHVDIVVPLTWVPFICQLQPTLYRDNSHTKRCQPWPQSR